MKDDIFRGRMSRDSGLKTIDSIGTKKTTEANASSVKASEGMNAAVAYDNTLGGANDLPPMGEMGTGMRADVKKTAAKRATKPVAGKTTATATAKSAAKKTTASTAKKSPSTKSRKNDDDYVLVEEALIFEEYI